MECVRQEARSLRDMIIVEAYERQSIEKPIVQSTEFIVES